MKLKRIGILSLGYALAIIYGIIGLLQGTLFVFQIKSPSIAMQMDPAVLSLLSGLGFWLVPIITIIMLILGFLGGLVLALIYNFVIAKLTGGLELEFSENKK